MSYIGSGAVENHGDLNPKVKKGGFGINCAF